MILKKTVPGKFDKELIPLLKELNKVGIKTIASCIGHEGSPKCLGYISIDLKSLVGVRIDKGSITLDFYCRGNK